MRLVVLYGEPPAPPSHGGRVDVHQRLLALKKAGVEVFLVCWANTILGEKPDQVARDVAGLVTEVRVVTYGSFLTRPWLLARYPGWIAARVLDASTLGPLVEDIRRFKPGAILVDGLPCAAGALQLVDALGAKYLFRSHNREYLYVKAQARLVRGWRDRLRAVLNLIWLKAFEEKVLRGAEAFYDISASDLAEWRRRGFMNGEWLPPIIDAAHAAKLGEAAGWAPGYDVGYLGNLVNPNNVEGVLWFAREVMPLLRAAKPDVRMLIAGSKPVPEVVAACRQAGVTLLPNPADAAAVLRDCRVLVNPVFQGSGVNLKSVEMLHTPAALVATSTGVGGMPETATRHFSVADKPEDFATAVLAHLGSDPTRPETAKERAEARAVFSARAIEGLIARTAA